MELDIAERVVYVACTWGNVLGLISRFGIVDGERRGKRREKGKIHSADSTKHGY